MPSLSKRVGIVGILSSGYLCKLNVIVNKDINGDNRAHLSPQSVDGDRK